MVSVGYPLVYPPYTECGPSARLEISGWLKNGTPPHPRPRQPAAGKADGSTPQAIWESIAAESLADVLCAGGGGTSRGPRGGGASPSLRDFFLACSTVSSSSSGVRDRCIGVRGASERCVVSLQLHLCRRVPCHLSLVGRHASGRAVERCESVGV
eukprot:scaffold5316_cov105-Isochrysis_galbana.AAC.6